MNTTLKTVMQAASVAALIVAGSFSGCKKKDTTTPVTPMASYQQTNLVANTSAYNATRTDSKLLNAWGMALGSTGIFWISANHSGTSVVYDYTGAQKLAAVNIPLGLLPNGASPTGVVYNSDNNDFVIPGNGASTFIFATEDGIISAWNSNTGSTTVTVADRSGVGAVYKGLAINNYMGVNYIYATDFYNRRIDVFDRNFALVNTMHFNDNVLPAGYSPFNIQNIDGQLFVTYAKQKGPDNKDDDPGLGNGYIDVFDATGVAIKHFDTKGMLNSPWGIVKAPDGFGQGTGAILVGNFGDGHISVFDVNGVYQSQLANNGSIITIKGLWALTFNKVAPADPNTLYFTAGPNNESDGIFGYLKKM